MKLPEIKDKKSRMEIDRVKLGIIALYKEPPKYYESEIADRLNCEFIIVRRALCELKDDGVFQS